VQLTSAVDQFIYSEKSEESFHNVDSEQTYWMSVLNCPARRSERRIAPGLVTAAVSAAAVVALCLTSPLVENALRAARIV